MLNLTKVQNTCDQQILESVKMFEFTRILSDTKQTSSKIPQNNRDFYYGIPRKRSGHRAVCTNENLWIWGGFCPARELQETDSERITGPLFPELWRFNFSTRLWCRLQTTGDVPSKFVASHSALLYGKSTLIVFGGTGFPFGDNLSNFLYVCNLNTLVWKKYELTGDKPLPLYGSSLILIEDYLYILFGTNAVQYCSNVYRVNLNTFKSEKLFDSIELVEDSNFIELNRLNEIYPNGFLYGRYRQEVIHHDIRLYTFGGGKIDGDAHSFDNLPAFNVKTSKWEFINTHPDLATNSYPEKRKFHSCIRIDEYVYVFGGMYCDLESHVYGPVDNCVWRLNMLNYKWEKLNIQIDCLTYFHAACSNENGQVFIHGGVETKNESNTRVNHLYTILLKIPKLSELCWSKLIVNYPKLVHTNKSYLLNLGVPNEFVKRIN